MEAENCPKGQDRYYFNSTKTCKQNFELIPSDGEFVKKQQCKKVTRVWKLNSFSGKAQRWKLGNNKKLETVQKNRTATFSTLQKPASKTLN